MARAGIKAIKLYAWEVPYKERLEEARRQERTAIRKTQLMSCINTVMFSGGPIIVAIAAFGTYTMLGKEITADVAFPALAYFDQLRFPIIMLPMQVRPAALPGRGTSVVLPSSLPLSLYPRALELL